MGKIFCKAYVSRDGSDDKDYARVMRKVRRFDKLVRAAAADPASNLDQIRQLAGELADNPIVGTVAGDEDQWIYWQAKGMNEVLGDAEDLARRDYWPGYTATQRRQLDDLAAQANAWTAIDRRLSDEDEAKRQAERNTPEAQEKRRQRRAEQKAAGEARAAAKAEKIRPHLDRLAPPLAARHGKPEEQVWEFLAWYVQEFYEDKLASGDSNFLLFTFAPDDATMAQWIWQPVEYHWEQAAWHRSQADLGDAGGLVDWDHAVTEAWDIYFRTELEPA